MHVFLRKLHILAFERVVAGERAAGPRALPNPGANGEDCCCSLVPCPGSNRGTHLQPGASEVGHWGEPLLPSFLRPFVRGRAPLATVRLRQTALSAAGLGPCCGAWGLQQCWLPTSTHLKQGSNNPACTRVGSSHESPQHNECFKVHHPWRSVKVQHEYVRPTTNIRLKILIGPEHEMERVSMYCEICRRPWNTIGPSHPPHQGSRAWVHELGPERWWTI